MTSGEFEVTDNDRQPWDTPGPPGETQATADLSTSFTDPAGNEYELDLDHIVKPPFPAYETGGGTLVPEAFQATVDQELTLTFENIGEIAHNLTVGEFPTDERSIGEQDEAGTHMAKTETIQPGATTSVTFTPDSTGTFPYWCDVPGHRDAGMTGEMTTVD